PRGRGVRRRASGRRARRPARENGVQRSRRRRALEVGVVDRPDLPDRHRLHDGAHELLPERDAPRGHLPRIHGRPLRDPSADRGPGGVWFAGGVLSGLVLLPLLSILGNYMSVPLPPQPASGLMIKEMSARQLWSAYIRYTGAGAVLASGLITLARTLPTIVSSFRDSVKDFGGGKGTAAQTRTERDIPATVVLIGSLALAVFLAVAPKMPTQGNFLAA